MLKNKTLADISDNLLDAVQPGEKEEMEAADRDFHFSWKELLLYIGHKIPLILVIALVGSIIVTVWTLTLMPATFYATEKLYIMGSNSLVDLSELQIGSSLAGDYQQVFVNSEIHERVREKLDHEYTNEEMNSKIKVSVNSRILSIRIEDENEYLALQMVKEYAKEASSFIEERMGSRIPSVFEDARIMDDDREVVKKALIGFFVPAVVLLLAFAAAFVLNDRASGLRDVESSAGAPVLGALGICGGKRR